MSREDASIGRAPRRLRREFMEWILAVVAHKVASAGRCP